MAVKYAGVDWLTMTTRDEKVAAQWWSLYVNYRKVRVSEGDKETPFNNGFYGGVKTGHMRWGHSEAIGCIVIVSGSDANRIYRRLQPAKHKVTRLDLCVDFAFKEPNSLAARLFQKLQEQENNKQRKHSIFANSDGGQTLYIGSRQSMQFGRIYDKGVKSGTGEPGTLWRAEVEYKKPMAGEIAKALNKIKVKERPRVITKQVLMWFAERNADVGEHLPEADEMQITVQQRTTTAIRKLAWLNKQVAPTVGELIEAGYGKEVMFNLMLDESAINKMLIGSI